MGIQLTKGGRFNLSKEANDLKKVAFALGWQVSQSGQSYDIDASVFMLGAGSRISTDDYFVFYNNLKSPDGSVKHLGDGTTGQGEGDDETIYIDLAKVNPAIQEMVFVVTIHEGQEKRQNFSQIKNAFIRLYNQETKSELALYELKEAFSEETALEFGRLYKKNEEWRFQASGQGYKAGLQSFVDKYCVVNNQEEKTEARQVESPEFSGKSQKAISLEKKLEQQAPHIFNLTKKADISLKKANLTNHKAKVALCLDISGSMALLYNSQSTITGEAILTTFHLKSERLLAVTLNM